jgi:hypothetical protein
VGWAYSTWKNEMNAKLYSENLNRRDHLGVPAIDRIILKRILKK